MEHGLTNLTQAARSVQLLKIDGYSTTATMFNSDCFKSRWNVGGHEWELRIYPSFSEYSKGDSKVYWVALKHVLLSEPERDKKLRTNISCRLVDPSRNLDPSAERRMSYGFGSRGECSYHHLRLVSRDEVLSSGYLVNDSLTVQCTITVLKELPEIVIPAVTEVPLPSSDLHRHFGELLQSQRGADVTFVLQSGDRFPAHKTILAARSPVFMVEFFGHMNERRSQSVRIEDMQAAVFKAMLHFVYTDTAPELDEEPQAAATMAQHLLAAADRYGLDRLKLICEGKLSGGIDVDTAATTLALAEQHNCSLLKAKCVDFIARSPETLDAVLATDGYRHLVESCPLVLTELLRATHGRRT
ncbi:BTB/POZ and MATH domain-containing protein 2 [Dichanthelium oligosanthes]|uniref:BTB/POZ and MATH domain-containing protein 2 n=1 Tax=Dichanthelium oligosanthes TaxID=888268 RepID=A0A1E5ULY1_9POAL|nr:BTB/POZ and MATH domain-containing protein 2 [Dichanthelium oligosanthes]